MILFLQHFPLASVASSVKGAPTVSAKPMGMHVGTSKALPAVRS